MKTEPIIMIADETLSVQAQLGEALGKRVSLVSAMNQEQLDYWLDEPARLSLIHISEPTRPY